MSSQFYENQLKEIWSTFESKGRFFGPDKLRNHTNEGEEKERARRKKGGEEKKAMVAHLVSIMATFEIPSSS